MSARLTRQQLHTLAWQKPMIHLAAELGLSDVGLRKACHRHDVPTPPAGWWAKQAHGKATRIAPLPKTRPADELVRVQGYAGETARLSTVRAAARARLDRGGAGEIGPDPIVERTIARLDKAKVGRDGLKRVAGAGLVSIAVRPESEARAAQLLRDLVAAATRAGMALAKSGGGAAFRCDGETVSVELFEAPDQVEHVATETELAAVAKWKREREEKHRKYGYWFDYGEPRIPKWEQQYNGRLAVRLEAVRARSEEDWWGRVVTRTFADSRTRDGFKMVPRAVEAVAAIAAAKQANRALDERRRVAAEEAARRREEEERRRQIEQQRTTVLDQLLGERDAADRLATFVASLRQGSDHARSPRVARLLDWAERRLAGNEQQLSPAVLEQRLEQFGLFGEEE